MKKVAIVDLVGEKAGMNYYDILLAKAFEKININTFVFSNFNTKHNKVSKIFDSSLKSKILKLLDLNRGLKKITTEIIKNDIENVIYHVFEFNLLNLLVLKKINDKRINLIAIVHDAENINKKASKNRLIKKIILNKIADTIIVHNDFTNKNISNIVSNKKIKIIPHGNYISLLNNNIERHLALEKLNLDKYYKYILFFGQIKKSKGLDILIKSLLNVDLKTKLIIAGKKLKINYNEIENIINENELSDRIIQKIYFVDDDEKDLLFNACDVCVLPYNKIYQSGVMLMSLSYGLPIIASDLQPNKEIITDNENGLLFENENEKDLANKINLLLSDNALREKISKNSLIEAKKYSWDKIANEYKKILI